MSAVPLKLTPTQFAGQPRAEFWSVTFDVVTFLQQHHIGRGISDHLQGLFWSLLHGIPTAKHIPDHDTKLIGFLGGVENRRQQKAFEESHAGIICRDAN